MKIVAFLLQAKKNTYANSTGVQDSSRPSSYDLKYQEGDLLYIDSYLGTHKFSGEEAVWHQENPVWAMNYSGRVLDESLFRSKFLKKVLMHPTKEYPYRGQPFVTDGDYTYRMDVSGDFSWFSGKETIYHKDQLIYELVFHGGVVDDRHFD